LELFSGAKRKTLVHQATSLAISRDFCHGFRINGGFVALLLHIRVYPYQDSVSVANLNGFYRVYPQFSFGRHLHNLPIVTDLSAGKQALQSAATPVHIFLGVLQ
jgi:hypothetical protein